MDIKKFKISKFVIFTLIVVLVVMFLYILTPYKYIYMRGYSGINLPIRVNRLTGITEYFTLQGWMPIKPTKTHNKPLDNCQKHLKALHEALNLILKKYHLRASLLQEE